ncbi:hypothetical protein A2870_04770 [Candidatus Curtissbacteria bacterium RIFCSPHIGHO2_01_FULL_41_11]|uniref:DUF1616 domain-containing protein n=1 Tax=Candidatus Curtissbacteria bacterium RIFCSPHIGHO2_01_FULL_41_11 TaxID=1797711 RepID=A0A1F5G476_9BACT|nr:MAG: hypothetical protein A2870_04770 [Candidatus Curtissbacteria bacterium RIFCSPHIGHO2_01_FULL_41_11]
MKSKFIGEIIISFLLIGLLIFFINPLDLLMPQPLHPFMAPFLVVLFIIFAGFLWKETPGDEREQMHKFIASRSAYFATIATLISGVILQSFKGEIDLWIIIAICVGLLAKILGLIYGHIKH